MSREHLEQASDYAFQELEAVDGDPARLPEALATVVIVYGAQGVIDNGGFRYFFEADFPRKPSYELFVEAYRRIGAVDAAAAIAEAVALFPFADPHLHVDDRNAFLNSLDEGHRLFALGDSVCGDHRVWDLLAEYCKKNGEMFSRPRGGRTRG